MTEPRYFTFSRTVSSEELQATYAHVHHAKALCFLEEARYQFLEAIGFPFCRALEGGLLIVLTHLEVAYRREITAGDITITCGEPRIEGKLLTLRQQIFNHRKKLAVEGQVTLCFMEQSTRRGVGLPEDFSEALKRWVGDLT